MNEHEGLTKCDIDGDGLEDIVGGGRWFKYLGPGRFAENVIDASYTFTRAAAGQFVEGGRPEVILVAGDGIAPMYMYTWKEGTWYRKLLIPEVDNGHTLDVLDFNHDGHLDIFSAEMGLGDNNEPKTRILLGDGQGTSPIWLLCGVLPTMNHVSGILTGTVTLIFSENLIRGKPPASTVDQ